MSKTALFVALVVAALLCTAISQNVRVNKQKEHKKFFFRDRRTKPLSEKRIAELNAKHPQAQFNANQNPFEISGYFNVNSTYGGNMYYVFFPSKDGRQDAPVVLWLQGGPGCSSMDGLFAELGPYRVNPSTLTLEDNPNSWNSHYHLMFIDNPLGAGFSYVEKPDGYVHSEELMAKELYSTITQFFGKYPQYGKNDFYVFGESYAGKYVPAIANKIHDSGYKVNLKGIGIGDGLTHPIEQFTAYDDFAFATGLINLHQKLWLIKQQNKSIDLINKGQFVDAMDAIGDFTNQLVGWAGGVNVYDIREYGDYDFTHIAEYLALKSTQELMHTDGHKWNECSGPAYEGLYEDMAQSIRDVVIKLLDAGLKTILYNGQFDLIVNSVGAEKWINNMPWKYQKQFLTAPRKVWHTGKKVSGFVQQYQNLYQAIVSGAGHLAPMNQGESTLDMLTRFVENKPFN